MSYVLALFELTSLFVEQTNIKTEAKAQYNWQTTLSQR